MYRYLNGDTSCFAGNLIGVDENGEKILKWDVSEGCGLLMVLDESGGDAGFNPEKICELLREKFPDNAHTEDKEFFEIEKGLSVRYLNNYIANVEKKLNVTQRGRYIIFACKEENGERLVYEPRSKSGNYYDVSLKVRIRIQEKMIETGGGIFRRATEKPSGFFSIEFPQDFAIGQYKDEEISYMVKDIKIPITAEAIKQGKLFIRSEECPKIFSNDLEVEVIS